MIFCYRNLVFIFFVLLFSACSEREFVYKAQPVDIKVTEKNGTFEVEGSSVFQLPDTFVWGVNPIQIDEKGEPGEKLSKRKLYSSLLLFF